MKWFNLAIFLMLSSACATASSQGRLVWRVKEMALAQSPAIDLVGPNQQLVATVSTRSVQNLLLAHFRIARAAGVNPELVLIDGNDPNASVGVARGQYMLAVNIAMLKLIGEDIDEFASLLGHEYAHLAKGHIESSQARGRTLQAIGTLAAIGLGAAGVPGGGYIAGLGLDLIESSFSRDQEREADAVGVDYVMTSGFDPQGAIRLQEKLLKTSRGALLPFLTSHPGGEERIENLKALVREKSAK